MRASGERLGQAQVVVQIGDVEDLRGVDVVVELGTGVRLEGVRRVVRLQPGLEHVLGGGAGTAGHRAVDELGVRMLLVEDSTRRRGRPSPSRTPTR